MYAHIALDSEICLWKRSDNDERLALFLHLGDLRILVNFDACILKIPLRRCQLESFHFIYKFINFACILCLREEAGVLVHPFYTSKSVGHYHATIDPYINTHVSAVRKRYRRRDLSLPNPDHLHTSVDVRKERLR